MKAQQAKPFALDTFQSDDIERTAIAFCTAAPASEKRIYSLMNIFLR
jgi:hypothetical protein